MRCGRVRGYLRSWKLPDAGDAARVDAVVGAGAGAGAAGALVATGGGAAAAEPLYDENENGRCKQIRRLPKLTRHSLGVGTGDEGVELDTIGDGAVCLGGAGAGRCHGRETEGDVASLVAAELCEVRPGELTVEEAVELLVLWRDLAVWHLETVGLFRVP